jgi:hypothetical protein
MPVERSSEGLRADVDRQAGGVSEQVAADLR